MSIIYCNCCNTGRLCTLCQVTKREDFDRWVAALEEKFGNAAAVARAAGISQGAYTRQVVAGKLGIMPLLKLSLATGESASVVLRRAKKDALADLLEQCYGPPRVMLPALRRVIDEVSDLPESLVELTADWIVHWTAHGLSRESSAGPTLAAKGSTRSKRAKRGNRKVRGKRDEPTTTP